mmetsp:Transcript_89213/g.193110  ORF Transcript_89213/g.193110 Transcript_89213/m.193110 type:complete len:221 (-) Transcript_89213:78-740(-)
MDWCRSSAFFSNLRAHYLHGLRLRFMMESSSLRISACFRCSRGSITLEWFGWSTLRFNLMMLRSWLDWSRQFELCIGFNGLELLSLFDRMFLLLEPCTLFRLSSLERFGRTIGLLPHSSRSLRKLTFLVTELGLCLTFLQMFWCLRMRSAVNLRSQNLHCISPFWSGSKLAEMTSPVLSCLALSNLARNLGHLSRWAGMSILRCGCSQCRHGISTFWNLT